METSDIPARFAVVGTGWRARYYIRLGARLSERLELVGVVGRSLGSAEQAASVAEGAPAPAFDSLAALLAHARPEFVVVAVSKPDAPAVTRAAVEAGLPVLSETPPAPDLDGLRRLWAAVGVAGKVQVAEQYHLLPSHAARLALVRAGDIGRPTSCQVSSTHGYHAVALIRRYLDAGMRPATITARRFVAPLIDPLVRDAWTDDPDPKPAATTIATLDFGGLMGLYDFTDNQWHNQLRSRRIVVRGSAGEIEDDEVVRLVAPRTIVRSPLVRRQTGYDLDLDGFDTDNITLGDRVLYRNPFPGLRFSDEEIAISSTLTAMADWVRQSGPAPYPLAEACQDQQLALAIDEAAATGLDVTATVEPWAATRADSD